jgi:hypothetical protein
LKLKVIHRFKEIGILASLLIDGVHMNVKLSYLLVGALAAAGAMASAHADVVEVDGAHVRFFYDNDFWSFGTPVVNGDSITFAVDPNLSLTKTAGGSRPSLESSAEASSPLALTVVAKSGYRVGLGVNTVIGGNYSVAAGASNSVGVSGSGILTAGNYRNGVFFSNGKTAAYGGDASFTSGAGVLDVTDTLAATGNYRALQASLVLGSSLVLGAPGTSTVAPTSYQYGFSAAQVAAVPEPATYGMLLGGLGLMGMVARRRKNAPK